jgi:hypothetical protein
MDNTASISGTTSTTASTTATTATTNTPGSMTSSSTMDDDDTTATTATVAPVVTAAVVRGNGDVAIVGGTDGVTVVRKERRKPVLSGGFGR